VSERRLGLFEAFGVEIELMIVDRETLDVKPQSIPISTWLGTRPTPTSR
jgi:hypothetical protein